MQFSSVYILYGAVNGDVITKVDCIMVLRIIASTTTFIDYLTSPIHYVLYLL